jgi:putative addiction module component (TIGR02574 family)
LRSLTCATSWATYFIPMAITNLAVVEEALSLAPAERADLAKLLVQSLEGDSRTDEAIKADLTRRLEDLVSGKDSGLTFNEVFGPTV